MRDKMVVGKRQNTMNPPYFSAQSLQPHLPQLHLPGWVTRGHLQWELLGGALIPLLFRGHRTSPHWESPSAYTCSGGSACFQVLCKAAFQNDTFVQSQVHGSTEHNRAFSSRRTLLLLFASKYSRFMQVGCHLLSPQL